TSDNSAHNKGNPITKVSAKPLTLSVIHNRGVLLLKPNLASNRNCSHHSKGSDGIDSKTPAARIKSACGHTVCGGPMPTTRTNNHGRIPPKTNNARTSVSNTLVITPNRERSSV